MGPVVGTRWATDIAMGSIINVVAVLLTHMLTSPEDSRKPAMIAFGLVPRRRTRPIAMRRCNCQRSMASAMMKPPRKR